ncbi:hypothetical protein LOTGIDRAFT_210091 [Lottia gigantea]|uniref:Protein-lysine N-methyltransferase LOTGIDRAFT_210091 n=1 Tax=Lottia gigantea TaxID=225164 RepID=V3ZXI8_LOTGI|nr:hypothetical protein LOTGIDRAFT_210091 [Lottia gigantea]ESO89112.1 hypothetical protein LOTGIDRAFT_210091 [Lottia gigantea]
MADSDDDVPQLSAQTLAMLQEFYTEQEEIDKKLEEAQQGNIDNFTPQEDWQLSQFWYNDSTATRLAQEVIQAAGINGKIAFVSSPTAYKKFREIKREDLSAKCLEFDNRFKVYGEDFIFYNYEEPLNLRVELKGQFDIVLADPPFLSDECIVKTAQTIRYLTKNKIIVCTGAVMEEMVGKLLGLKRQKFKPQHANGLQNEFCCFTNYNSDLLNKD